MVILFNIPEGTGMLGKSLLILQEYYPLFWYGVKITLLLSMLGTICCYRRKRCSSCKNYQKNNTWFCSTLCLVF